MNTALTIISVFAAITAFNVSKSKKRRRAIWTPLCFCTPAALVYLLQTSRKEKTLKPLLVRYAVAFLVAALTYLSLSPVQVGSGYSSYEMIILENVEQLLNLLNLEFHRDERLFRTPTFAMEITEGLNLFYGAFILSAYAIVQSIFLKPLRPATCAVYGIAFSVIGHIASVLTIATLVIVINSPEQVSKTPHEFIRNVFFGIGIAIAYIVVLGHALVSIKTQSQSMLATQDAARRTS